MKLGQIRVTLFAITVWLSGAFASTSHADPAWREIDPGTPTLFDVMAYDEARQQLVLFGGDTYNTTWIWDGSRWTKLNPPKRPGQRLGARMAYDPNTQTVIMFGGNDLTIGLLDETWSWNGTTWTQLHPAHAPSARFAPGLVYDVAEGKLVLFGGEVAHGLTQEDTWTWDGNDWTQQITDVGPSPRFWPAMAYDPDTSSVVLFGGQSSVPSPVINDTWTWTRAGWSLQTPITSPPGRGLTDIAYSPISHRMVLFGGVNLLVGPASTIDGLTWQWDGTNWSSQQVNPGPGPRFYNGLALDKGSGNVILQGGNNLGGSPFGETWIWNGSTWSQPALRAPGKRSNASMALDSTRKQTVLFGGLSIVDSYLADTWTWDGQSWTLHQPSTSPSARVDAALAEDPVKGNVVLFGGSGASGYTNETWIWDGADWTLQTPATSPSVRSGASMHYDPQSGYIILFGGTNGSTFFNETWAWNGQDWIQLNPATSPNGRHAAGFARDGNGHLVLFGGALASGVANDTWTWDGTNWIQQSPTLSPPGRQFGPMAYSSQIGTVILFGGISDTNALLSDTWKWDGTSWVNLTSSGPGTRNRHVLAEGPYGDAILFGDIDRNDTWSLGTTPVQLNSVVSRKSHGNAGTFDIIIGCPPCAGLAPSASECRRGGSNGEYTIVFAFSNTLTSVARANVSSGSGSVASSHIDSNDPHSYVVNLTGVTNQQVVTVALSNVTDSVGNFSSSVNAVMNVLIGDTNGDGFVNSADIGQTKSQSGRSVTSSNFREDVNADGFIDSADIGLVKSKSGTAVLSSQ